MKKFFREKLSREKVARFFDKEGFYIVLFLCVCIVGVTAVWVSRSGVKNNQTPNIGGDKENKAVVEAPNKETSTTSDKPVLPATGGSKITKETKISTPDDKNESIGSPASTVSVSNSKFKIDSPIKDGVHEADISRKYSADDLVEYSSVGAWMTHLGLDIKAVEGTEVLAVSSGKVVDVRNDNDYINGLGWTVVVDHGNGYKSIYSNLDENIAVKKDDTVKTGQKIGTVGNSSTLEKEPAEKEGISHLHFELMKRTAKSNYDNVDPMLYMTVQK